MTTQNDILSKVKALLNMTTDHGCTEAEANTAMEKAQALMLQHNLTMANLSPGQTEPATPSGIGKIDHVENDNFSWRSMLAHVLAKNTLCKVICSAHTRTWHIFGTYDNVRAVLEMYTWLSSKLEARAIRDFQTYKRAGGRENGRSWKVGFFEGALSELNNRLKKPFEAFTYGNGRALVLYNDKALTNAVKRVFPHTTHSSRSMSHGVDGRGYGRAAGSSVSLTPQRKLSGSTLALGAGR